MKNNHNIDKILKRAYEFLEKGDLTEAKNICIEGFEKYPGSIALANNLAQIYAMKGDIKESKKYHQKLIELCENDTDPEGLILKANSLMSLSNFSDALETYKKVLGITPTSIPALFQISAIYSKKKEFQKSNKYLNRILAIDEENIIAILNKGWNYEEMKNYHFALKYYDTALKISPRHEEAIILKGRLLKEKGDTEELKKHINQTLKVKPDSAYTLMLKAMEFAKSDNEKKTLEYYRRAITADPHLDEAYFNMASFLMLKKRYDEAIEYYKQAFEINPESGGITDREGLFELLNQMKHALQ